eukprot:Selendium_serpulae@DN10780_c0_g1_i1.p1
MDVNSKDKKDQTPFHVASAFGRLCVVNDFAEERQMDVNSRNERGVTELHCAASGSHLEVVKSLVEDRKMDAERPDNDNGTALEKFGPLIHTQSSPHRMNGLL